MSDSDLTSSILKKVDSYIETRAAGIGGNCLIQDRSIIFPNFAQAYKHKLSIVSPDSLCEALADRFSGYQQIDTIKNEVLREIYPLWREWKYALEHYPFNIHKDSVRFSHLCCR